MDKNKKYIVAFMPNTPDDAFDKVKVTIQSSGGKIMEEYTIVKGFSVECPEGKATEISKLIANPYIEAIEEEQH